MRAFTVHTGDDGRIVVEPGIRLEGGRLTLPAMEPTADLLAQYGPDGLIDRTTPYRRLDPTATTIDLGPEVLPDVRALVLLDGRGAAGGAFFAFVHHSDKEAGVEQLMRVNASEGERRRAQMVELVVLMPDAAVPVLLGGQAAQSLVRWDGRELRVEPAPPGASRAARPADVRVPV
ncbi:MAG TPA: hypothetical protein VGL23_05640 [Chloroflexota bacterium]